MCIFASRTVDNKQTIVAHTLLARDPQQHPHLQHGLHLDEDPFTNQDASASDGPRIDKEFAAHTTTTRICKVASMPFPASSSLSGPSKPLGRNSWLVKVTRPRGSSLSRSLSHTSNTKGMSGASPSTLIGPWSQTGFKQSFTTGVRASSFSPPGFKMQYGSDKPSPNIRESALRKPFALTMVTSTDFGALASAGAGASAGVGASAGGTGGGV
mmetsp:Transcript_22513/g.63390  ORF Transcript_22513/g.63390 Transcript_22513/m.63390 type:complete len:212 (+) Transcript_22513:103-738(+)